MATLTRALIIAGLHTMALMEKLLKGSLPVFD